MFSFKQIFRESIGVLLFATLLSLIAGIFLRNVENRLLMILPLIVILPALNGMIGGFGIVITSKFATALYEKKINNIHSHIIKHLFKEVVPIAIFSAFYIGVLGTFFAYLKGFDLNMITFWKIIVITLITSLTLVFFIFIVSIIGGIIVYKRGNDPDDILIPITTSIADLFSISVFSLLVFLLF